MAAVLGRTLKKGVTGDFGSKQQKEEAVYFDSPRSGLLNSSFALFYIVVITLNTVAIGGGIISQWHFHHTRNGYRFNWLDGWYLCNAIFGILHILAALYIVRKIEEPNMDYDNGATRFYAAEQIGAADPAYHPDPAYNPGVVYDPQGRMVAMNTPQQKLVMQEQQLQRQQLHSPALPQYAKRGKETPGGQSPGEPETMARVKYVLCQSQVVAVYILVFVAYVIWHTLFDVRTHYNQKYLKFVMHCADVFILAGPASFVICVIMMLMRQREIQ